ncbi:MAG TPA: hypothetical protein VFL93_00560 [Longimicrobiaceae bacterium]|nr:hypothetical protein [Longimicrobiaceae bacterium]
MRLETFRGRDLQRVFDVARDALGEDAMIVGTRVLSDGEGPIVEVTAAPATDVERFRRRIDGAALPDVAALRSRRARPFSLALVGPTGAGKTTTLAKLAVHPEAFGGRRVGLLTLDTYRVGAIEQLATFADIAGLPLEVVYAAGEVRDAMKRLSACEVILIDCPGRSPRRPDLGGEWIAALAKVAADEIHLVLPATMRTDVAEAVRDGLDAVAPTHLLLSKLDEVPGETGLAELADRMELPARWVTDGQEVPADLRTAPARIIASLGRAA